MTIDFFLLKDKKIATSQEKNPCKIKWNDAGVTYVIEATGVFNTLEKSGVRNKVINLLYLLFFIARMKSR